MKKQHVKINNMIEFEYEICVYLMRKRIRNAIIYTPNNELADRLGEYMTHCKIPWCYKEDDMNFEVGFIISPSNEVFEKSGEKHVCIASKAEHDAPQKNSTVEFLLKSDESVINREEEIDLDSVPIHLQNSEIRRMFLYAFKIAEEEIDIISPWMNSAVINKDFLELMESALMRGVTIKILYGMNPYSDGYSISRSRRSDEVAEIMQRRFADMKDRLIIKRDNIHYKLVLCDNKYKLEGGFNYLSFIGNYSNSDTWREGSPFGRDAKEIMFLRHQYFEV